ncbi:hypothetical protein CsSME_00044517 [Camellia sinensis var. sinensis]
MILVIVVLIHFSKDSFCSFSVSDFSVEIRLGFYIKFFSQPVQFLLNLFAMYFRKFYFIGIKALGYPRLVRFVEKEHIVTTSLSRPIRVETPLRGAVTLYEIFLCSVEIPK